eukprot:1385914-Rhodomonas_salina.3
MHPTSLCDFPYLPVLSAISPISLCDLPYLPMLYPQPAFAASPISLCCLPMRCPVLAPRMLDLMVSSYTMSGTDVARGSTGCGHG